MKKYKIMTITGTREEMIVLSPVIRAFDLAFEQKFIHTGKPWDYDPNKYFLADLSLRNPDLYLEASDDNSFVECTTKLYNLMKKYKPDLIVLTGKSNSEYAALCAKELKIPVFYIHKGCLSKNNNSYGEINADITAEVSPLLQLLSEKYDKIIESYILTELGLENEKYIFVSIDYHKNRYSEYVQKLNCINEIATRIKLPLICSINEEGKNFIKENNLKFHPAVKFITKLSFTDYCKLQLCSNVTVSDRETAIEECEILDSTVIYIGSKHREMFEYCKKTDVIAATCDSVVSEIDGMIMHSKQKNNSKADKYRDISANSVKLIKTFLTYYNLENGND